MFWFLYNFGQQLLWHNFITFFLNKLYQKQFVGFSKWYLNKYIENESNTDINKNKKEKSTVSNNTTN